MPKSRKRRSRHAPRQAGRARFGRLLPHPGAAEERVRQLPQSGCRRPRRHRARRRPARQRLLGHAEMADRQSGGAPRRQAAGGRQRGGAKRCWRNSARCRAISAATASSPSRAAISRKPKSRRRPCAARNSPTSRRRRRPCASGGASAHDPQAQRQKIPALFAQSKSAHRQAAQSRDLYRHARPPNSTSATSNISSGTSWITPAARGGCCWRPRTGAPARKRVRPPP